MRVGQRVGRLGAAGTRVGQGRGGSSGPGSGPCCGEHRRRCSCRGLPWPGRLGWLGRRACHRPRPCACARARTGARTRERLGRLGRLGKRARARARVRARRGWQWLGWARWLGEWWRLGGDADGGDGSRGCCGVGSPGAQRVGLSSIESSVACISRISHSGRGSRGV